jgi:THO complex subunit 2
LLEALASPKKDKLKSDGTNIAQWFQSLASFAGFLYRKYTTIEITALLQYVVNQLKDGSSLDLVLLRELIAKMSGVEIIEDMSENQLEAQAGGETLKLESQPIPQKMNLKRSTNKLKDTLLNNKLALPLMILIAQQRSAIIFKGDSQLLKMVGDMYDKVYIILIKANIIPSVKKHSFSLLSFLALQCLGRLTHN